MEYCHVVYHSMLSKEQSERLEKLQRKVLRIIYGFENDYNVLLNLSGNVTLKERRESAVLKFARSLVSSDRFCHLFQESLPGEYNTRNKKRYIEEYARTSRLFNSPIFHYRRILNEDWNDEEDCNILDIFTEE